MADTYITNKRAQLYNSNGAPREYIAVNTIMTCDWPWDSGVLKGMRKILTVNDAPYGSTRFIKDIDVDPYTVTPPAGSTPYLMEYDENGTFVRKWVPE